MDIRGRREGLWRIVISSFTSALSGKVGAFGSDLERLHAPGEGCVEQATRQPSPARRKAAEGRFDVFDIVVVPFPYADRLAEKRRPALVISNRRLAPFGLIWVTMITSADNAPWSCDVTIADLARAGLPAPSVVRAAKIACIEPARIERRLGRLDRAAAKAVAQKLKGFLGSA
jgi:mRNA interferase MazF